MASHMQPHAAEHRKALVLSVFLISIPILLVIGLGVWAWMSGLEESVPGAGQLVPEGSIRVVMAPAGGVVDKVYVKKNQLVKAGQVLMSLDPEQSLIESKNYNKQLSLLREESIALQAAFQGGRTARLPVASVQRAWLSASQETLSSELGQARHDVEDAEHALKETTTQIEHTRSLLSSQEEQQTRYHALFSEGGIPKVEVDDFDDKVTKTRGDLAALEETAKQRKAQLEKARKKPTELVGSYQKDLLGRLAEHERNISQLESSEELAAVNLKRTYIRAPVDGIVHEQTVYGPGDVVPSSSEKLFSIVPANASLVAEVKVSNRDLSYIRLNQKAALSLDALPYQQFGRLSGHVSAISPSSMVDEKGNPFYLVRIVPERNWMKDAHGKRHDLRSGMTVNADIITREKSIISFFTEPVEDQLDRAFRDPTTR